jgi:acetyl/propionyl-CoA carboxylase alpha subunit
MLTTYRAPTGPGVRVEDGVESGSVVSPYYDPMLAKVITWGQDRPEAIRKMGRALRDMVVLGVTTNIPYLLAVLEEPQFQAGNTTTNYLNEQMAGWTAETGIDEDMLLAAAVFEVLNRGGKERHRGNGTAGDAETASDPWNDLSAWRNL